MTKFRKYEATVYSAEQSPRDSERCGVSVRAVNLTRGLDKILRAECFLRERYENTYCYSVRLFAQIASRGNKSYLGAHTLRRVSRAVFRKQMTSCY